LDWDALKRAVTSGRLKATAAWRGLRFGNLSVESALPGTGVFAITDGARMKHADLQNPFSRKEKI